jgi:hypothetical protein
MYYCPAFLYRRRLGTVLTGQLLSVASFVGKLYSVIASLITVFAYNYTNQ